MSHLVRMAQVNEQYESGAAMLSEAKESGYSVYGWVRGRFYQVYPGGRCVDYTDSVRRQQEREGGKTK